MEGEVKNLAKPAYSSELHECLVRSTHLGVGGALLIGNLRSYGDQVLSSSGNYIQTNRCDRILQIDIDQGTISVECGITIDAIQVFLSRFGCMLPVTPGTALLTVGGAIANDVHGKNHHVAGTFGSFVECFELVRSNGDKLMCSQTENAEWFAASIGGMGLTGAITWAKLKLRRVASPRLNVQTFRFRNLDEFFEMDAKVVPGREYAVSWIDCLASRGSLGRGILSVADHAGESSKPLDNWCIRERTRGLTVPFAPPVSPINRWTLHLFNELYFRSHGESKHIANYGDWLYPLDSVKSWNLLYGGRGFYQFQCVVPPVHAREAISSVLRRIATSGQGSFLAVLKNFGEKRSPGLMSFPMCGTTLALDFPNLGPKTRELLMALYEIIADAGGRLYPAKDGCSPENSIERGFPHFADFKRFIDPAVSSVLGRRLRMTL